MAVTTHEAPVDAFCTFCRAIDITVVLQCVDGCAAAIKSTSCCIGLYQSDKTDA